MLRGRPYPLEKVKEVTVCCQNSDSFVGTDVLGGPCKNEKFARNSVGGFVSFYKITMQIRDVFEDRRDAGPYNFRKFHSAFLQILKLGRGLTSLPTLPVTVRRQHNIENYIVDFYIAEKKIVIEVDGIQHTSHEHKAEDEKRDADLLSWNITVLRYGNDDIRNNFNAVADDILKKLNLTFADLKPLKK